MSPLRREGDIPGEESSIADNELKLPDLASRRWGASPPTQSSAAPSLCCHQSTPPGSGTEIGSLRPLASRHCPPPAPAPAPVVPSMLAPVLLLHRLLLLPPLLLVAILIVVSSDLRLPAERDRSDRLPGLVSVEGHSRLSAPTTSSSSSSVVEAEEEEEEAVRRRSRSSRRSAVTNEDHGSASPGLLISCRTGACRPGLLVALRTVSRFNWVDNGSRSRTQTRGGRTHRSQPPSSSSHDWTRGGKSSKDV